ncbi:MAG TPA: septum formation initiator family protein [Blastocatellia bacterium]|nr:septum formation initiator family protein [Blastocatellia bacterium]
MSQVANTFWDSRLDSATRQKSVAKRRVRVRRLVDGVVLTIILAALATCVSVHTRSQIEMAAATAKYRAAVDRIEDLSVQVEKRQREIESLRTDTRAIEFFARQRFGFVRAGDVVIRLAQDGKAAEGAATEVRVANLTPRSADGYTARSN